ncbi:MAG: 3-deoxy-D-manno-octulosonic acid transferase [Desulfobacterium sp.]|jgi:3-deoxy-D-manno-octulosonic-acid transferase|nr:3-deoxy-D-manno-octulosonic acid transferase [Desulfobacterium sp.]
MKLFILIYNLILSGALFLALPFLPVLAIFSRKRRATLVQRFGLCTGIRRKKPHEQRIWVHALSVGEVISAKPLLKGLQDKGVTVIFTASTLTGFNMARTLFLNGKTALVDQVALFPFDFFLSVNRVCSRIDPDRVILVETDLWPNFLWSLNRRKVPVFLVNARLSISSFRGYLRFKRIFGPVFSLFSMVLVQTGVDARRFRELGVDHKKIKVCGNLKFDQEPPRVDPDQIAQFRHCLGRDNDLTLFLAGSTHPGEEQLLADLFLSIKPVCPPFVMVVAPRDPNRAEQIQELFSRQGLEIRMLSTLKNRERREKVDIVIVDAMGLLSRLYAACDIAFIGGSLAPFGGHNPLEAAAFSRPILFGPHMEDFLLVAQMLVDHGGAFTVSDRDDLIRRTVQLIHDPVLAQSMGARAADLFLKNRGAVDLTLSLIGCKGDVSSA